MGVIRALLACSVVALLPPVAAGDVIPISDVNADDANGYSVLLDQVVTVKGVVTVGTGYLSETNNIYIQDATGGVNVVQIGTASPTVSRGDSVRVTGKVDFRTYKRTCIEVDAVSVPGSQIEILSTGNPVPDPVVVTPRALATESGEDYEGTYAVLRRVELPYPSQWPSGACSEDAAAYVADADTTCRIWFDTDTDLCGSDPPLDTFDVYGVVVPRPRNQAGWYGHGILPPERSWVLSRGDGSGRAEVSPERVFGGETVEIEFALAGEADTLTDVRIVLPEDWGFSGDPNDVSLEGPAFDSAQVDIAGAMHGEIVISGCSLVAGLSGTVAIGGLEPPEMARAYVFDVATAVAGGELTTIQSPPEIEVGLVASPGAVLINEVYAHANEEIDDRDRAEFIELCNPGTDTVDVSGWVLTDLDESSGCGGSNLWGFPSDPPTTIPPGGYVVVTKDAWEWPYTRGFIPVFGDSVDFDTFQIFELVDEDYTDTDWEGGSGYPDVPNMVLLSPVDDDLGTSQEIRLLGGFDGDGPLVANLPACDAVYLYSDVTMTYLVDAVEYRDPVFLRQDYCGAVPGLGGADDAFTPGPPPEGYSLGRDELSTDTDSSADDFVLSSRPTPGARNVPSDTKPPAVVRVEAAGDLFVVVEFNEPLDSGEATDCAHYVIDGLDVEDAWLSRDGRTVLLQTTPQVLDETYAIDITEVADAAGNVMEPASSTFAGYSDVITPLSEVQSYDEMGYSPLWGQEASVVGFTTVPPGVFQPDRTNMYIEDIEGMGLNVYSSNLMAYPALEGDLVKASGLVLEYRSVDSADPWSTPAGSTTEISSAIVTVLARGFDVIEPLVLPTGDVGDEDLEGSLVRTSGVVVSVEGFSFYVDDGTGACQVYQNFTDLDFSKYAVGDSIEVTGVVLQYDHSQPYFGGYELAPRYDSDLVQLAVHYAADPSIETSGRILDISNDEAIDISFNAPRSSHVAVRVFDVKGRAVATLFDGFCLGSTRTSWDGRDDGGRKVPPGVYICHVQAMARSGEEVKDAAVPIVVGMRLE